MLPPLTEPQEELLNWIAAYIQQRQVSPSLREMMRGVGLRSPAPVQSRLEHLRQKGYITWAEGKARTVRLLHLESKGIPLLGAISASGLITTFTDTVEPFNPFSQIPQHCFALRLTDTVKGLLLQPGDILLLKPVPNPQTLKTGEIVAVQQQGQTTLKRLEQGSAGFIHLQSIDADAPDVCRFGKRMALQGVMVGVWRHCA